MKVCIITLAVLTVLFVVPTLSQAEVPVTVRLTVGQNVVLIDLLDNPAAKAFVAQLPLTLQFKDFAGTEKIATLPKRLNPQGSPSAQKIAADFTYFAPWGNLAIFYNGLGNNDQLLALGHIRTGKAVLANQHMDFTATLECVNP